MMTFTEAAVHVLRLVGKPLHYKEITDVAIEKDLLSHVGKSPEVTMGARLAAVVKKGGKDNLLARVKPGVFALAEWSQKTIDEGLSDRTPALERMAAAEEAEAEKASQPGDPTPAVEPEGSAVNLPVPALDEEHQHIGEDEKARAQLSAAATALFEPEDDDDEPILGGSAEEEDDDDDDARRKGRRRRRRGRDRDDDSLPSYTVSDASFDGGSGSSGGGSGGDAEESAERPERGNRERERRERDGREGRERDRGDRERGDREGRERDRGDRERGDREGRERDRGDRERGDREGRDDGDRRADDGLEGAALIESCLLGFRRSGVVSIKQLVDAVGRRPAGKGADSSWVSALMRADNVRRSAAGERARFRLLGGGRVALFEWGLDRDALATEKAIKDQAERLRVSVRKQLLRKLNELPHKAAAELWMVLLERLGYGQFKVVRRPGAHSSELHWSAVHTSAGGDVPVAIVVRRDGRDLGRERVADLRGSLHHYGAAAFGVLVTTGQVMSGAREEASAPFATPVVFVDGAHAAELCERHGVGVVQHCVALPAIDTEWFEALRSGQ